MKKGEEEYSVCVETWKIVELRLIRRSSVYRPAGRNPGCRSLNIEVPATRVRFNPDTLTSKETLDASPVSRILTACIALPYDPVCWLYAGERLYLLFDFLY